MKDGQDFKKFAAELVSPSELFESGSRSKATAYELIALLGSLEHITRFNLQPQMASPAASPSESSVRYATSRDEYKRALEDENIGQALAQLARHRQRGTQSRAVIRPQASTDAALNAFQHAAAPSVNVSVKKTEITGNQRRSLCQPILRET
jgi:hypothetical protein